MAGAILVADKKGVSLSSVDFDYILEKTRTFFRDTEAAVRDEIFCPIDEGGMSFISMKDQGGEGFKAFLRATTLAFEQENKESPRSVHRAAWESLVQALQSDARASESGPAG